MFNPRREHHPKRTAKSVRDHQETTAAYQRIHKSISEKNAASKKDPWAPSRRDAGSTHWRTAVFSKDSEGNTFMNNVRTIRAGSKPRTKPEEK